MANEAFCEWNPPALEQNEGRAVKEVLDAGTPRGASRIFLNGLDVKRGEIPANQLSPEVAYWARQ